MYDDTKKYFDTETPTILTTTDLKALGDGVESLNYMKAYIEEKNRFVPHVDFSKISNFAKFGSAEQYYRDAIERIYKTYPYDGSLHEKTAWHNSSSYFDNHVFDKEYPRSTGYAIFSAGDTDGWGTKGTEVDGYSSSSLGEYVIFKGGPHPSLRSKGKKVTDTTGDYKSGFSNILDLAENRESNLKIGGIDGNSVEFWLKKDEFLPTLTKKEVIFDAYTANAAYTDAGYGRLRVELTGHGADWSTPGGTASPFLVTYMSGTAGYGTASIGSGITRTTIADGNWHHYALTFKNELDTKSIYFDGGDAIAPDPSNYIDMGSPIDFNPWDNSDEFSVSFWFRCDATGAYTTNYIMSNVAEGSESIFTFYLDQMGFLKTKFSTAHHYLDDCVPNCVNYCDGNWHHVVVVVYQNGGAKYKAYVDGSEIKSETSLPGTYTTPSKFIIGKAGWLVGEDDLDEFPEGYGFGGYLDEVTIWNTGLSEADVVELYNNNKYYSPANHSEGRFLIHWWKMGETVSGVAPGHIIIDEIGSNNGQMKNFTGIYGISSESNWKDSNGHVVTRLYIDGECNDTIERGDGLDYVSGAMVATIGALATMPSASTGPALGWGKLSGSLDEFRFWKTERNAQEIGRHWFTQIGAGANTDTANTDLGVYYKFNEGITTDAALDSLVLDYSGRISNGAWVGYTANSRNTGSAIVSSSVTSASFEFRDPILYPSHTDVNAYLTSSVANGKEYDHRNNAALYRSFPAWIVDEDAESDETLKKLTQIMASYFDTLYLQIQELPRLKNVEYISGSFKPYPFSNKLLESKGFIAPEIFPDAEIIEQFLNRSEKELFTEKLYDVKNKIYQNIYNNLVYIYKSKGTEKAFRNLIRCFGVDHELLKLNLYGNQITYPLENNYSAITIKKRCVDFNNVDRFRATVYQFTASSNTNSISYISGSTGTSTPFTTEAEIIFPKKFDASTPPPFQVKHNNITSSLFGMHTALQPIHGDPGNLGWAVKDEANFQVYAVRKTLKESNPEGLGFTFKDVYFMLTGSEGGYFPLLTSDVFREVYENEKWNFSVAVRPTEYPLARKPDAFDLTLASTDTYTVEFYGVNTSADTVMNEFLVTGTMTRDQGAAFLTGSKRLYMGAHRTNFTGAVLQSTDVKASSARCWLQYLTASVIRAHARDPKNFGSEHPYRNTYLFEGLEDSKKSYDLGAAKNDLSQMYVPQMETLALNWDFEIVTGSGDSSDSSPTTSDAKFLVEDISSGSSDTTGRYGWVSQITKKQHTGRGDFFLPFATGAISKEYIHIARQNIPENLHTLDTVNILDRDDEVFTRETRPITHFFAIEKSMYQTISEQMLNLFGTIVDYNNLIGEPINRYRQDYKDIAKIRQLFYERVGNTPDLERYVDYYKWIDSSLSQMIEKLIPASARFAKKIRTMVESHALERNKYWTKFPTLEKMDHKFENKVKQVRPPKPAFFPSLNYVMPKPIAEAYSVKRTIHTAGSPNLSADTAWWHHRAERNDPAITSGDSNIDHDRNEILSASLSDANRKAFAPVRFDIQQPLFDIAAGRHNNNGGKRDIYKSFIDDAWTGETKGLKFSDVTEESVLNKDIRETYRSPAVKVRLSFKASNLADSTEAVTGRQWAPFSLYSSSVNTGYNVGIPSAFGNVDLGGLHIDTFGPAFEVPLQGPFTEKFVGGAQHRHVDINYNATDTSLTRPEGWLLEFDGSDMLLVSPLKNSTTRPRAMYFRDEGAKRPVNIRNIRQTTGSSPTKIGNYTHDYQLFQGTGRTANRRYFIKNNGLTFTSTASTVISGVMEFALPNENANGYDLGRTVTGSDGSPSKYIFANRFSAPGGPEVLSRGYLNAESEEYSVYNALPWRNLGVRTALYELLTNHTKQFGFFSDTQNSASYALAGVAYPGTSGSVNELNYNGSASFHKVHRNVKKVYKYSSGTSVITASIYNNWWFTSPFPQSDMQYAWITASALSGPLGFEKPDYSLASEASTDITFLSNSDVENAAGIKVDFANINSIIYDPLDAAENTLSSSNSFYGNTVIGAVSDTHALNALLLHRNGPYQHPSWKQIRGRSHPVIRYHIKQNTMSATRDGDNSVMKQFTEPMIISRYLPMIHTIDSPDSAWPLEVTHTYGNNLATLSNRALRDFLGLKEIKKDQVYDELKKIYVYDMMPTDNTKLLDFVYRENIWPREENTFLNRNRTRTTFVNNFWKENRSDRNQYNITSLAGKTVSTQSMWAMDARFNHGTTTPQTGGFDGAGVLQNNYVIYHSQSTNPHKHVQLGPLYAYTMWDETDLANPIFSSDTLFEAHTQAGKDPFYNSYDHFAEDIRKVGKDYSIIPEFVISEHLPYYMNQKAGNFMVDNPGFLTLTGSQGSVTSNADNFYKVYAHSDFLKYFEVIKDDYTGKATPAHFKLKCKALMKFVPYDGFYPAERTVQLFDLFSQSYGKFINLLNKDVDNNSIAQSHPRTFFQPLWSPGVLYNTIKSGIAVDWPIHTDTLPNVTGSRVSSPVTTDNCGCDRTYPRINTNFSNRIPFESLVDPQLYLANKRIADSNPHPSASLDSIVRWGGESDSELYRLGMHNFLAESIDFFLEGGELTNFVSQKTIANFSDLKPYVMDVGIYRSHSDFLAGTTNDFGFVHLSTTAEASSFAASPKLQMYSNWGAFGPLVDQSFLYTDWNNSDTIGTPVTGAARNPFTPPYYSGRARARIMFTPDRLGDWTMQEIIAKSTVTYSRVRGVVSANFGSPLGGTPSGGDCVPVSDNDPHGQSGSYAVGSLSENGYMNGFHNERFRTGSAIDFKDSMHISASLNLFQMTNVHGFEVDDKGLLKVTKIDANEDVKWVIGTKFETPILNFSASSQTLPDVAPRQTAKGMWHQYGTIPNDDVGIYVEITDPQNHNQLGDYYSVNGSVIKDTQPDWNLTGSLAEKVGFIKAQGSISRKKLGRPSKEKVIREAIVVIPFRRKVNKKTSAIETKFFDLDLNQFINAKESVENNAPPEKVTESYYDMVSAMKRYVFPPKFDFLTQLDQQKATKAFKELDAQVPGQKIKGEIDVNPVAMYIFEFKHTLSQQDITDIWQNLPPSLGTSFQKVETTINHRLLEGELMTNMNDSRIQWLVFKVKQKAKTNYYEATAGTLDDIKFKFDLKSQNSGIPAYSYNWPYDYCSIVELARIEANTSFDAKGDTT